MDSVTKLISYDSVRLTRSHLAIAQCWKFACQSSQQLNFLPKENLVRPHEQIHWSWKFNWNSFILLGSFPGFNARALQLKLLSPGGHMLGLSLSVTGRAVRGSWNGLAVGTAAQIRTSPTQNPIRQQEDLLQETYLVFCSSHPVV